MSGQNGRVGGRVEAMDGSGGRAEGAGGQVGRGNSSVGWPFLGVVCI